MTTRTRSAEREQFLADIITAGIEGGIGYWSETARYKWDGLDAKDVHAIIQVEDDDEARTKIRDAARDKGARLTIEEALALGALHKITIDTIAAGIGKITRGELKIRDDLKRLIAEASRENDAGDIDAEGADCIIQAALFGELIYG